MKPQPSLVDEHLAVQRSLPWYVAGMLHADEEADVARHLATCAACRADVALEQRLLTGVAAADPLPEGLDAEAALARLMPRLDGVAQEVAPLSAAMAAAALDAAPLPATAMLAAVQDGAPAAASSSAARGDALPAAIQPGVVDRHAARQQGGSGRGATWRSLWRRVTDAFDGGGWRNWALAAQGAVIVGLGVLVMPAWHNADPAYRALGSGSAATPDVVVMFQPDARADHVQQVLQASGARIVDGPTVTGAYLLDVDAAQRASLLAALRADPAVRLAEPLGSGVAP